MWDAGCSSGTQGAGLGRGMNDAGCKSGMRDAGSMRWGCRVQDWDAGCRVHEVGCTSGMRGAGLGRGMKDAGCRSGMRGAGSTRWGTGGRGGCRVQAVGAGGRVGVQGAGGLSLYHPWHRWVPARAGSWPPGQHPERQGGLRGETRRPPVNPASAAARPPEPEIIPELIN